MWWFTLTSLSLPLSVQGPPAVTTRLASPDAVFAIKYGPTGPDGKAFITGFRPRWVHFLSCSHGGLALELLPAAECSLQPIIAANGTVGWKHLALWVPRNMVHAIVTLAPHMTVLERAHLHYPCSTPPSQPPRSSDGKELNASATFKGGEGGKGCQCLVAAQHPARSMLQRR